VMLFQLLTGRTPFEAATQTLLLVAIITEAPTPIARVNPALPPDLCAVVDCALQPDRAQRYQTMQALLDAVTGCSLDDEHPSTPAPRDGNATSLSLPSAQHFGLSFGETEPPRDAPSAGTPMQWAPPPVAPVAPPAPSRRGLWGAALALVALLAAGGLWWRQGASRAGGVAVTAPPVDPVSAPPPAPSDPEPVAVPDVSVAAEDVPVVAEDVIADVPALPADLPAASPDVPAEPAVAASADLDAGASARASTPRTRHRVVRRPRNNAPILAP